MDIKRLALKIDAAQQILDEIRLESGCETFERSRVVAGKRHETALQAAVRAYEERKARAGHFDNHHIFGEPAWDILLDLYIHQARNESVCVKSATIGAGTSPGTARRWLEVLDAEGLVCTEDDPQDSQRRLLRLTSEGYEAITSYLNQIARSSRD